MKAKLILENGMIFEGKAFGYLKESVGEVVFTTGMTGYQEVLTDPSYYGQIVTMTYPLIGNYGINLEDMESDSVKVSGFIVREKCNLPSNFRCELDLDNYLKQEKVIGLEGIDTRALTKVLRNSGTMKGIITLENVDDEYVKERLESFSNKNAVKSVTATAEEVLNVNPDLVFLSNGPGDPEDLDFVVENVKKIVGKKPIVGICLGHQLLALTLGGKTTKLKFGHRGCNHPVKDLERNIVHITSQNHGYVVQTLPENMEVTHVNINDGTVEGMKHKQLPIYSVQFHPEASAGPQDSEYIFDRFLEYAL